ncbi:MAG: ion channel [Myxococcota bacterium]|nr:ion channel [Myxococcota bacterium]
MNSLGSSARIIELIIILLAATAVGTAGFVYVEGMGWINAFYLAVVTIPTVGYGDVVPLTPPGRIFAALLIITGIGITLYFISVIAMLSFEGQLSELFHKSGMSRRVESMNGHVIVCGYGRFGRVVAEELRDQGREVVVIESDSSLESALLKAEAPYIIETAASDEILEQVGLSRGMRLPVSAFPYSRSTEFVPQ